MISLRRCAIHSEPLAVFAGNSFKCSLPNPEKMWGLCAYVTKEARHFITDADYAPCRASSHVSVWLLRRLLTVRTEWSRK